MSTLQEIRAKLQSQIRTPGGQAGNRDNTTYNHWDIPEGGTAVLRFLPDGDPDNTFFWAERQVIKLPFSGVKGDKDHKSVIVQVPCMDMWERNSCPVVTEIGPWFNDPNLEALARTYWKKRTYVMQGFVIEDGLQNPGPTPENPIRKFIISPQIFKIIKTALLDPDMENNPVDLNLGTNFRINKTKSGQYADYSTSKWVKKDSALSADQLSAIQTHGLFTLKDFMPKKPTAEDLVAIKEMFEASVNGDLYDLSRWGKFYKPFGVGSDNSTDTTDTADTVTLVKTPNVSAEVKTTPTPKVEEPASGPASSAQEILARIRRRSSEA